MDFVTTILLAALCLIILALIPIVIFIWHYLVLFIKGDDKMLDYKTCTYCGAHLDPGERCTCVNSRYARLTPDEKEAVRAFIATLLESQRRPTQTN